MHSLVARTRRLLPIPPHAGESEAVRLSRLLHVFLVLTAVVAATFLVLAAPEMDRRTRALCATLLAALAVLAFLRRRANRRGLYAGIIACVAFTAWATLTGGKRPFIDLGFNFGLHEFMIGVIGHLVLFTVGLVASILFPSEPADADLTVWGWLAKRRGKMGRPA